MFFTIISCVYTLKITQSANRKVYFSHLNSPNKLDILTILPLACRIGGSRARVREMAPRILVSRTFRSRLSDVISISEKYHTPALLTRPQSPVKER